MSHVPLHLTLALCALASPAAGQTTVVNVDVGNNAGTYSGQGAFDDPSGDFWNGVVNSGIDLIASDGTTATDIDVTLTSTGGFNYDNSNNLLSDYQYVTVFSSTRIGDLTITGLEPNEPYLIYVYSAGDKDNQAGIITLNGVMGCTTGGVSNEFIEGANYVVIEVDADASGSIAGTWEPYGTDAAINGLQIVAGSLPTHVRDITGAESVTVHSPGDVVTATLSFSDDVTLSQVGGADVELDIDGTRVKAVHAGATTGTSLTFEAIAPTTTSTNLQVVADSLRLLGSATLIDSDLLNVALDHDQASLANDHISEQGLSVYPPVLGLEESPHYRFRVREVGSSWQSAFAWHTKCIEKPDNPDDAPYGYYQDQIGGWSHNYCNFEMANHVAVEVEITRLDATTGAPVDIQKAIPHPRRNVKSWRVERGKAYVTFDRPTLFAVDIDGDMDDNPTPSPEFINETALHGVSVFANPFILDKPDLDDPDVLAVEPGKIPEDDGTWKTLYFKPGVHQLFEGTRWAFGDDFRLRSDRSYYIPGDALVHGNMNNGEDAEDGRNIRIFGHGTLSGELIDHPTELGIGPDDEWRSRAIRIASDARGCTVEGVTMADPAHHSCALVGGFNANPAETNYVRWAKVISWRANGDGITPNGSSYLEDCFLRTQDDGTYIYGLGIRRMVYWTDVNGMPLRCDFLTSESPSPYKKGKLYVEDIDVLYARTGFGSGPGRSVIGYPDPLNAAPGNTGSHVVFRNINVDDPFPTRMLLGWDLTDGGVGGVEGPISGVRFENIRAAAPNVDGDTDTIWGDVGVPIDGLIFDNVTVAGEQFDHISDFVTNGFVSDLQFEETTPETITFLNHSGCGKWYLHDDWDTGSRPSNVDWVKHTAVGDVLIVDAPAYAGRVHVSHADTATLSIREGAPLTVTRTMSVGASGVGRLELLDGTLQIESRSRGALDVANGTLHLERGEIRWAGNHVAEIRALYAAGKITFANGGPRDRDRDLRASRIATQGRNRLFVAYDDGSQHSLSGRTGPGYTTVWVTGMKGLTR